MGSISQVRRGGERQERPAGTRSCSLTPPLAPQGMPIQLHTPYSSEHAKVPVGSITMGLPLTMDPKKLGKKSGGRGCLAEHGKEVQRVQV